MLKKTGLKVDALFSFKKTDQKETGKEKKKKKYSQQREFSHTLAFKFEFWGY